MLFDTTPANYKNILKLLVFPNLVHFLKVKFHVSFYINRDIWTGDKFEYSSTNISLTNLKQINKKKQKK